jgi:hypothetical protein
MNAKESYTIIAQDLRDPILMRLEFFVDRDKMKEFLLEYAREHKRCIVLPGPVDDMDYQVEYENDEIKALHFEDEPGYKPPFIMVNYKDIKHLGDNND